MIHMIKSFLLSISLLVSAPAVNTQVSQPDFCFMAIYDRQPTSIGVQINCNNPTGFAVVLMDKAIEQRVDDILYLSDHPELGVNRRLAVSQHDQEFHNLAIKELP